MSLNGYSYVEGNVPNRTDPSGLQTEIGAACAAFILADGPFPVGDAACAILLAGVGAAALLNWIRVAQNFATAPGVGIPTRVATPNIYPDVNNPNEDPNGLPAEWTRIPPPSVTATATAPGNGLPDGAPTLLPGPFVPPFQDPMSTPAASPAPTATCTPTPPSTPTPSPTPNRVLVAHYTSMSGANGILNTGVIYASSRGGTWEGYVYVMEGRSSPQRAADIGAGSVEARVVYYEDPSILVPDPEIARRTADRVPVNQIIYEARRYLILGHQQVNGKNPSIEAPGMFGRWSKVR
jgi:hypothetical protein